MGWNQNLSFREKSITTQTFVDEGNPDDPPSAPIKTTITVVTYKFTQAAAHLLSITTGISEADIQKVGIRKTGGSLMPTYDPNKGGGAITFPGNDANSYRMNLTDNFFDNSYGANGYKDDVMEWLDLTSHEVGHIKDIQEIGGGKAKYFRTFISEYANAGSHDGNPREQRADIGRNEFRSFVSFVNSYYGKDKVKALFENSKNTDKEIIGRIDQWWKQYQKQKEADNKAAEEKKKE